MKRTGYEIRATFPNGLNVGVEIHKTMKNAQNAIDAMNHMNDRDEAEGYGFPMGRPTYTIKTITMVR